MPAVTVIELTGDEKKLAQALTKAENQINKLENELRNAGAGATASGMEVGNAMKMIEAANTKALKSLQQSLRLIGPEGKAAAEALKQHMVSGGAESTQAVDSLLKKIQMIDPEAAAAAAAASDSIKKELHEAARYSEQEFSKPLDELRKMGPEGKRAADEIKKHLVSSGRLSEKSMHDVLNELEQIDPAAAKIGRKLAENNSLKAKGVGLVTDYALKFGSLATIGEGIRRIWQQINEEKKAGLTQLEKTQDSDRRLLQVSATPAELQANKRLADSLSQKTGVDSDTVRRVLFSGISEGFKDAVPKILEAADVADPMASAGIAGQIPKLYDKDAITSLQAISGVLTAAKDSRVDFETLGRTIGKVAEGGGVLGSRFAQDAAVMSVLASEFATPDTAADRIKGFSTQMAVKGGFKDKNIIEVVNAVSAMPEDKRKDLLGDSQELNVAYAKLLKNRDEILRVEKNIERDLVQSARGGGMLNERIELGRSDATVSAMREQLKAEARLAATQRRVSGIGGAQSTGAAAEAQNVLLENDNLLTRAIGGGLSNLITAGATSLGFDQSQASQIAVGASRGISSSLAPATAIETLLRSIDSRLQSIDDSASQSRPVTPSLSSSN